MDITKIILFAQQIAGNPDGNAILTNQKAVYVYDGNQKTDQISHYKYEVVFPDHDYEKVNVKIKHLKPLFTEEQLEAQRGKVRVKFKNLTGKFYRTDRGEYALTCSADGVEVIA